jgi:hypothetical protein
MTEHPVFEVLHLDDQPELVAWIPRAISTWFWKNFTDDMIALPPEEEEADDERSFNLRLRARQELFDTRYRIFTTPEELMDALDAVPVGRIVLILLDQSIGGDTAAGSDIYRQIDRKYPEVLARVFVLSAYPNLVLGQLGWSEDQSKLIVKPAAPEMIIAHFITNLIAVAAPNAGIQNLLLSKIDL